MSRTHVTLAQTPSIAPPAPNQVWSWDITYLPAGARGTFFYLYLFVDVWSRRIMKAVVLGEESAEHAARLLAEACAEHDVQPQILTLHSDNGGPMKGSTMLATMQRLGVVPSFSRPSVSDDNPYSEALFRTLKYVPAYPRKPFAIHRRRLGVGRASSPGTTASTGTAPSGSSPPTSVTAAGKTPSSRSVTSSISALAHANPERWSRVTRNWTPIGLVVLNPPRAEIQAAA